MNGNYFMAYENCVKKFRNRFSDICKQDMTNEGAYEAAVPSPKFEKTPSM